MLTGDRAVRALNARYRGKDRPTDVLSFPGGGVKQRARRHRHQRGDRAEERPRARPHPGPGARRPGPARFPARARIRSRDRRRDHGPAGAPAAEAAAVIVLLKIVVLLVLAAASMTLAAVEAAFYLVKRRRLAHVAVQNPRAELVNKYLDDPPTLLMPVHMGTYTAHVAMTVGVVDLFYPLLGQWAVLIALRHHGHLPADLPPHAALRARAPQPRAVGDGAAALLPRLCARARPAGAGAAKASGPGGRAGAGGRGAVRGRARPRCPPRPCTSPTRGASWTRWRASR